MQEEGLARAVLADDEPCRRPTVSHSLKIADEGGDLMYTPDLDVLLAAAGNYASTQRLDDGVTLPGPDAGDAHARSSPRA
jgi:hypothetical protein